MEVMYHHIKSSRNMCNCVEMYNKQIDRHSSVKT
jgi:hypothetical protein